MRPRHTEGSQLTFQDALRWPARLLDAPPHVDRPRLHLPVVERRALKVLADRHILVLVRLAPVVIVVPAVHAVVMRMLPLQAVLAPAVRVVLDDDPHTVLVECAI